MAINCFLFDCDGTLVKDEFQHLKAVDAVLMKHFNVHFKFDWHKYIVGTGSKHVIEFGLKRNGIEYNEELLATLLEEKERMFLDIIKSEGIELMPGAKEFLEESKERGIKLVVASGLYSYVLIELLKLANIHHFFDVIVGGENKRRKPHPDIFIEALKLCNIKAENAMVFEDSIAGIEAAKSIGTKTAALLSNPEFRCSDFKSDFCFKDFYDALSKLNIILNV